jgi:hypothetical protein
MFALGISAAEFAMSFDVDIVRWQNHTMLKYFVGF